VTSRRAEDEAHWVRNSAVAVIQFTAVDQEARLMTRQGFPQFVDVNVLHFNESAQNGHI